jgi:hypothetical protein
MTLLISDVLPAVASCYGRDATRLRASCQLPEHGPELGDLAALAIVAEFSYPLTALLPPLAAPLGRWILESDQLRNHDLGVLLPDLGRGSADPRQTAHVSEELRALLTEHHVTSWQTCCRLTCSQITGWTQPADTAAEEFAALVVRQAALEALALSPHPPAPNIEPDLRLISAWGSREMGLETLAEAFALLATHNDAPPEVAHAWRRVAERPLAAHAEDLSSAYDLDAALKRVLCFDSRLLGVLSERLYPAGKRRTLDELGRELGVTRERVRQIEKSIQKDIERRLADPANAIVRRAATRLARQLRNCVPLDQVPTEVRAVLTHDDAVDGATLPIRVLLQMAGPYEVFERWAVRAPAEKLIATTSHELQGAMEDGTTDYQEAEALLLDAGIPETEVAPWLVVACKCRVLDGRVVSWTGSIADKSARILALYGEPRTVDEIVAALGSETNVRSLLGQIQGDPRFLRRGKKHYGLSSWGGEEYTKISDEIAQEIERQGGSATLEHLIDTLCEPFGVSSTSVRAYASGPPFVRLGDGRIAIGEGDDRRVQRQAMEHAKGCFKLGEYWSLRVAVDAELLRGSGRLFPVAAMQHLELQPGSAAVLETPHGDISLRWDRQPHIGSLRDATRGLSCKEGDLLFVRFMGDLHADFVVIRESALASEGGVMRLALEVGAPADDSDQALRAVRGALGFSEEASTADIRRRLRARRENELAELVPADPAHEDDDILAQLIGLGE